MRRRSHLAAAFGAASLWSISAMATPKVICSVDGQTWATRPVEGIVTTRPFIGTRLTINVWADKPQRVPYLQVTADWKRLKGKSRATLSITNATPDSPLDAVWADEPLPDPHPFLNAPTYHLESGTLKVSKRDAAGALDLTIDLLFRGGDVKVARGAPSTRRARVGCTFEQLPIKELAPL